MNSMLATDADEAAAGRTLLEIWGKNEPMRHVPSAEWMSWKVDQDLRRRIEILFNSFAAMPFDDARRVSVENELRALCRAIDRLTDAARHVRNNHPPHDLGDRIAWSLNQTVASLNSLDPHLIGRRFPFQTAERSRAEPLYGALLVVIQHIGRVLTLIRAVDRNVDEHLLDGLVKLETPLRPQPIA
jgi:hypothetical protein